MDSARAQQAAQPSYDEVVRRALQEFTLEHWAEAKVLFAQAHTLKPTARTLRGLGMTCYESRHYVEAIGYFERALAHTVQPLTPSMREDMQRVLAQARQFVSRAVLKIAPQGSDVVIDGQLVSPLGPSGVVLLDPGVHEVAASASGFASDSRRVTAEGGNAIRVDLFLKPVQPTASAPAAAAVDSASEPVSSGSVAPWLVIGASGALTIAGGVLLGVGMSKKDRVESPGSNPVWSDYEGSYNSGKLMFPVGAVMLGVGLAGVAAGIAWKVWPSRDESQPSASLRLQPGYVSLAGAL